MEISFRMVLKLRSGFLSAELRRLARYSDANQVHGLLSLALIYDRHSRTEAAKTGGVGLQIVCDWVVRVNADGLKHHWSGVPEPRASFTRLLDDGRVCLSNNAAERAVRGVALGRKSWLFSGSNRGGECAAAMYSLIYTCRLNEVDPQAYLADVLARINGYPNLKINEFVPWNWKQLRDQEREAA